MIDTDWKFLTLKSYTALAFYALAVLTIAPDLIFLTAGIDTNPAVWTVLQLMVIVAGVVGRIVLQPKEGALFRRVIIGVGVVVTLLIASQAMAQTSERATMRVLVPLVIQWEGEHRCADDRSQHCAYLDIVGVPTLCYGETRGVRLGDRATDEQCLAKLRDRLTTDFRAGLHGYFADQTKRHRLTAERDAAYVSLAYNVGIRGAGRSTATRRLNNGDIAGGCKALTWWNKAGGRVVRGLVNRRSAEYRLCMAGLS